eukprot:403346136
MSFDKGSMISNQTQRKQQMEQLYDDPSQSQLIRKITKDNHSLRSETTNRSKKTISGSLLQRISIFHGNQFKKKFKKLKQTNNNFLQREIEQNKRHIVHEYHHHLQRQKDQLLLDQGQTTALPLSADNTFEASQSQLEVKLKEHAHTSSSRPSTSRLSNLLVAPDLLNKLKVQVSFTSLDEQDLKRFLSSRNIFSKHDKKYLVKYVLKGIPESLRGQFWLVASGAKNFMQIYNKDYYQIYKGPFQMIRFSRILKIKHLQNEYQKLIQEEIRQLDIESFWVFCMIIENYLPYDYFSMMIGVLVDQKVFMKFLQCDFRQLYQQFMQLGFDPSVLFVQWFTSLCFLDMFFLQGCKALFKIGVALIQILQEQIMYCDMFQVLEPTNQVFNLYRRIIEIAQTKKITNRMIRIMRNKSQAEAFEELREFEAKQLNEENERQQALKILNPHTDSERKKDLKKQKFISRFQLFVVKDRITSIVDQSIKNPNDFFKCDHETWPICAFDFTYRTILPQYFIFRPDPKTINIIEDFYYPEEQRAQSEYFNFDNDQSEKQSNNQNSNSIFPAFGIQEESVYDQLLIERNYHICDSIKFKTNFINNYLRMKDDLYKCPHLFVNKLSQQFAITRLDEFKSHIEQLEYVELTQEEQKQINDRINVKVKPRLVLKAQLEDEEIKEGHSKSYNDFQGEFEIKTDTDMKSELNDNSVVQSSNNLESLGRKDSIENYSKKPAKNSQIRLSLFNEDTTTSPQQIQEELKLLNTQLIVNQETQIQANIQLKPSLTMIDVINQGQHNRNKTLLKKEDSSLKIKNTDIRIVDNRRTSVGAILKMRTIAAFNEKLQNSQLNEEKAKYIQNSTILAFNNNFL